MGKSCIICNNQFRKKSPISFHTFPKKSCLKKLWCDAIGINIDQVAAFDVICSAHFLPSQIKSNPSGTRKFLIEIAVPSVACSSQTTVCQKLKLSEQIQRISADENLSSNKSSSEDEKSITGSASTSSSISVKSSTSVAMTSSTVTAPEVEMDTMMGKNLSVRVRRKPLHHSFPSSIRRITMRILNETVLKQKQIMCKLKREKQRLKSRVASQKSLLKYLRNNNFLSKNAEAVIEAF